MFIIRRGYQEREYEPVWTQADYTAWEKSQQKPAPAPKPVAYFGARRESSKPSADKVLTVLESDPLKWWTYVDIQERTDLGVTTVRGAIFSLNRQGLVETSKALSGGQPMRIVRVKR
jgi:hypothetical protein